MKNLNGKELEFWNALVEDYKQRGDLSFLNIMFVSGTKSEKELIEEYENSEISLSKLSEKINQYKGYKKLFKDAFDEVMTLG